MRPRTLVIGITAVLLSLPLVIPIFGPWNRINCREQEIDISSGRRRDIRFLYWIPFQRHISDTALSLELAGDPSGKAPPHWHPVDTFGPFTRHSPHYIYHSAFAQIQELEWLWEELDAAGRRESARGLLREWQTDGSDESADRYLRDLTQRRE